MAWITVIVAAAVAAVDGRSIERRRERGEEERPDAAQNSAAKSRKRFSTPQRIGCDFPQYRRTNPSLPPFLPSFLSRCAIAEPADRIIFEVKVWGQNLNCLKWHHED